MTDSIAAAVIASFMSRPAHAVAELADIAATHRRSMSTVRSLLSDACATGVLKREGTEYSRGPQFPASGVVPERSTPRSGGESAQRMPQRRNLAPYVRIDPASVVLEADVPMPSSRQSHKREDWVPLVLRMKVGDSFVLPVSKRAQIQKCLTDQRKAGEGRWLLSILLPDKTHFRVWRLALREEGEA